MTEETDVSTNDREQEPGRDRRSEHELEPGHERRSEHGYEPVKGCRLVDLPMVHDSRGNLTFVEAERHVPFDIRRVYYLYDVPGGEMRAGHAHRELQQLLIAVSGSFDVLLDDGNSRAIVSLNRGYKGLLMSNAVWREILNFSSGAVCLVLASMEYREDDYFRDYNDFCRFVGADPDGVVPSRIDGVDQYTARAWKRRAGDEV